MGSDRRAVDFLLYFDLLCYVMMRLIELIRGCAQPVTLSHNYVENQIKLKAKLNCFFVGAQTSFMISKTILLTFGYHQPIEQLQTGDFIRYYGNGHTMDGTIFWENTPTTTWDTYVGVGRLIAGMERVKSSIFQP